MQGHLSEIDLRNILQLVEWGQRTGALWIKGDRPESVARSWFLFFQNGCLVYATEEHQGTSRMWDYLRRYRLDSSVNQRHLPHPLTQGPQDYCLLQTLLGNHLLTPSQGISVLQSMIQETLFELMTLSSGTFILASGSLLLPISGRFRITPLLSATLKSVQEWKQMFPFIKSPDQYLVIPDLEKLRGTLPSSTLQTLQRWANGETSLGRIARFLNRDIVTFTRLLYPSIQQGLIHLLPDTLTTPLLFPTQITPLQRTHPSVVCITDQVQTLQLLNQLLKPKGFEVRSFLDPLQALSTLIQHTQALIICDVPLAEVDSFDFCDTLQHLPTQRNTPIVLTHPNSWTDTAKAHLMGITTCLTKPFQEDELGRIVEHLTTGSAPGLPVRVFL